MRVKVTLTHRAGRAVNVHRLEQEPCVEGDLSVHLAAIGGLRRAARVAVLRPLHRSVGAAMLPDLTDIELLAFGDHAMMLSGFEEVGGRRLYQGWWVRWSSA